MDIDREFKIVLVGNAGVGKSAWLHRCTQNEFKLTYDSTVGCEITTIKLPTTNGDIIFNVWDVAGQENVRGLDGGYYIQMHAAIVMFDKTSKESYNAKKEWLKKLKKVEYDIPVILCGNKRDCEEHNKIRVSKKSVVNDGFSEYCEMSVKSGYNYQNPLLKLAKILMVDESLKIIKQI